MANQKRRARRIALDPANREGQLISDAMDLAHRQILDGTASAQVITHFLKAGSQRERLEHERLQKENQLLEAKIGAIQSAARIEDLYAEAISAMRRYSGQDDDDDYDDSYEQGA